MDTVAGGDADRFFNIAVAPIAKAQVGRFPREEDGALG